jgi:prolyl-tRNA synthetase
MPNGRTLQIATYHHYRDQWAEAFNLNYEDSDGKTQNCHQTTFGMSERLLGAIVGMHGDDAGLILPPSVAPHQVILMPIAAHIDQKVSVTVDKLAEELRNNGIRVFVDHRDLRPGTKHYDWEIKGAPIRLELGPRDLVSNQCVLTLRTGGKVEVSLDSISETINSKLDNISKTLRERAGIHQKELIQQLPDLKETDTGWVIDGVIDEGMVYEFPFDGNDADAEIIEKITGLTLLGDCQPCYSEEVPCIITGKLTTRKQHIARMY